MSKIFITGDRQMSAVYPGLAAIEMLRAMHAGHEVVTGDNNGIEFFVRELAKGAGIELATVANPVTLTDEGKPNWDERVQDILQLEDLVEIVAIHTDPHSSSIIRSLVGRIGDETLRIVTPADLLV